MRVLFRSCMSSFWSTPSAATSVRSSTSTRVLPRKAATRSTSISSRRARSSAIERIEVLRDGASAQYGSDAIAAVRNTDVTGALYYPLPGGAPDPRELTANRRIYQGGLPDVKDVKVAQKIGRAHV